MSFFVLAACQAVRMERDDIFFVFMVRRGSNAGSTGRLVEFQLDGVPHRHPHHQRRQFRSDVDRVDLLCYTHPHWAVRPADVGYQNRGLPHSQEAHSLLCGRYLVGALHLYLYQLAGQVPRKKIPDG